MQGGKDASSPRYINTKLANLTRHIFSRADDVLLDYLNEEGLDIEPVWCVLSSERGRRLCCEVARWPRCSWLLSLAVMKPCKGSSETVVSCCRSLCCLGSRPCTCVPSAALELCDTP